MVSLQIQPKTTTMDCQKLRRQLRFITTTENDHERTRLTCALVTDLCNHCSNEGNAVANPPGFFDCAGEESGIRLPPMTWQGFMQGFTFSVWIKVQMPTNSTKRYRPTILHLRTTAGNLIHVVLQPNRTTNAPRTFALVVKSRTEKGEESEFVTGVDVGLSVTEDQWHFLSLSFAATTTTSFRGYNGDITVCLDGRSLTRNIVLPDLSSGTLVEPAVGYLPAATKDGKIFPHYPLYLIPLLTQRYIPLTSPSPYLWYYNR